MSEDPESVTLDPVSASASVRLPKQKPIQVIFRNIEESYPVGADIQCSYNISPELEVTARDWVGLYRVGWRSQSDYIYYDWSPVPANYVKGTQYENKLDFPGSKLPKDDGEFYQFCYVTSLGQVRGASTPFQFKQVSVDDLIEIEDENGEMLVVKTKTAMLEEQLKKAYDLQASLRRQLEILEKEKDLLKLAERNLNTKLQRAKEENELLGSQIEEKMELISEQKEHSDHLLDCISALQDKMEVLNQEKLTMEKRLDDSDLYIISLQEKIKNLVTDKDSLNGRVRGLEEEKELYRTYIQECDRLKSRLLEEELSSSRLRKEVEMLSKEIETKSMKLDQQLNVLILDKDHIDCLSERLHNAEDKLSAAELCKTMLNEEVLTLKQAFEKISADLEVSQAEVDSLKQALHTTEQKLSFEISLMRDEKNLTQTQLQKKTADMETLTMEMVQMRREMEEMEAQQKLDADGSLYALQMAQSTLTERYAKMTRKFEANQKSLEHAIRCLREVEEAKEGQSKEIACLKERLLMGQEAYKEKYIQCEILESLVTQYKSGERPDKEQEPDRTRSKDQTRSKESVQILPLASTKLDLASNSVTERTVACSSNPRESLICEQKNPNQFIGRDKNYIPLKTLPAYVEPEKLFLIDSKVEESPPRIISYKPFPLDDHISLQIHPRRQFGDGAAHVPDVNATASNNLDEERFVDALDEPQMAACPICSFPFGSDVQDAAITEHMDTHFGVGAVCPMCNKEFEAGFPQDKFVEHVQKHFKHM